MPRVCLRGRRLSASSKSTVPDCCFSSLMAELSPFEALPHTLVSCSQAGARSKPSVFIIRRWDGLTSMQAQADLEFYGCMTSTCKRNLSKDVEANPEVIYIYIYIYPGPGGSLGLGWAENCEQHPCFVPPLPASENLPNGALVSCPTVNCCL